MKRQVFVILVAFLAYQVNSSQIRDIIDEAEKQLAELKSIVEGNILLSHVTLKNLEYDFLSNNHNVLTQGVVSIQQESETISAQVQSIKDLAQAANKDISSCTSIREELLKRLPAEYGEQLKECIFHLNREEATFVTESKYIIDISINKVHHLEHQFEQCNREIVCISPLLTEIQMDKIRLPQNIKTQVTAVESLLTSLKVSATQCSDRFVSQYTSDANSILQDIISCANRIIG
ncbi:hypothetical protein TcasGA2_TC000292 [Tribolium castaneum]|uniref:Protein TsetseEP domain-containing protein n=1 Tax=Tribolium castaneum TaxID=7070 RepID=D6WBB8_TRICA|nr:PREDICTED: uncharacterized protein LOC103312156 [Tribolium castaneum]EEZ97907.1 hypothetical protein TcasGA2_TC000292 [Tribolium castaneum]|eukprot:XP_008190285.1 PREDICTED: uncharacterized protein LOC103312156 [Tribolium castaneum]